MAIQQVGGQGVYVITGSGRDPRKTTSGQSWADLVTQQKYMLLKEAQKEAMRQMEQQQLSFEDRQKRTEQLRKNLQSQIEAERKGIENLRTKQINLNEARVIENQRIKSRSPEYKPTKVGGGGGGGGTSVTRTIPTEREYVGDLRNEITGQTQRQKRLRADRAKLVAAQKEGSTFAEIAPELLSATELQDLQNFEQAKAKLDESIEASQNAQASAQLLRDEYETASATGKQEILDKSAKKTIRTSGGSGGGGGGKIIPAAKTLEDLPEFTGFDPEIERRQQRMRELQAEMDALEFEERPTFNGIEETARVYEEQFGQQPRRRLRDRFQREPQAAPMEQPMAAQPEPSVEPTTGYGVQDDMMMVGGADERPTMGEMQPTIQQQIEQRVEAPIERQVEMEALGVESPSDVVEVRQDPVRGIGQGYDRPEVPPEGTDMFDTTEEDITTTPPAPTPTQGERFVEQMVLGIQPKAAQPGYAQQFADVKFGTTAQKQRRALELIIDASKQMGATSPDYEKAKAQILTELQKTMDPKQYRKQKKVERVMDKNPKDYMALAKTVRGLSEKDAQLVMALFAPSSDTKLEEVDRLYKSAQKEITSNLTGTNRKKALEFLELQYIAFMDDYNNFGK